MSEYKVLIVDDMVVNTKILDNILKESGYARVVAHSGEEALKIARQGGLDCILLDIIMPGMDGFEVIRHLKAIPAVAEVPVIFITGEEGPESTVKGFELGAVDYITKPFHHMEVQARLKAHIKLFSTIKSLANAQAETLKQINQAQNSLLKKPDEFPDAAFGVLYESLHAAGGDIYDIIEISSGVIGYFVGDFAGHQISTGFLTSSVKALLQQNCTAFNSPSESMRIVNSVLCELMQVGQYLTACYAVIDKHKNTLTVVNMGHPPLLFIPKHGNVREIGRGGDILGAFPDPIYREHVVDIYPGDRIFMYTDGLIEGKEVWSAATEFLAEAVGECRDLGRDELIAAVYERTKGPRDIVDDDVMVVVADYEGDAPIVTSHLLESGKKEYVFCAIRRLIDPCIELVINDLTEMGIEDLFSVKLVLYEAIGNAVVHGSKDNYRKEVKVVVSYDNRILRMEVIDDGPGFDWKKKVKVNSVSDEFSDSGRGLHLLTAYGFEFSYNDKGNHLYLKKEYR